MRWREFIAGLGSAAAWPLAAHAQQSAMPVIGYLSSGNPAGSPSLPGFLKGLSETGYVPGRNVAIEYRWTDGRVDLYPGLVADLVSRQVNVLFGGTGAVLAAKAATTTIPIVFRLGGDPVRLGLVASFNRPGGNVTGITTLGIELAAKRLELLRELLPAGAPVVLLANPNNANEAFEINEMQTAAKPLDLRLLVLHVRTPKDLEAAFGSIAQQNIGGLVTTADPLFFRERGRTLVELVGRRGIPAIYSDRVFCESGGLMSYGVDIPDGFRLAGIYTGRILKGEKPANLPVQQATKLELVINLKTAKALGVTIPETLLATADEVIQ
jgi:putative tryptophan/tyrosine transport system substrate-binding protein